MNQYRKRMLEIVNESTGRLIAGEAQMTRDQAIAKVMAAMFPPDSVTYVDRSFHPPDICTFERKTAEMHVDSLVALGLLKLDEPKSVADEAREALTGLGLTRAHGLNLQSHHASEIIACLERNSFRIVRS